MAGTLWPLACRYITGRVRRGEIGKLTAAGYWSTLATLDRVHGQRPAARYGRSTVERWLETREGMKASTRRTQWSYVAAFGDHLVEQKIVKANPTRSMVPPRRPRTVPRALERVAVAAVLAAAPDARARAVVWLEVGLGLRRVEVHRANVEDWSRHEQTIRVTGKGGHERYLPVTREVVNALNAYLREQPATVGPLIRSYTTGKRLSESTLSHYMAEWMTAAGVKLAPRDGVSGHALRHSCASDVLDECGDLRVVQELLGHQHLSSSSVYLRRSRLGELREAMEGRYAS